MQLPYIEAQNRANGMDDRTAYFAALRDLVPEATTLRRYDDLGRLVEERELCPAGTEENAIASEAEFNPGDGTHPLRIGGGDAAQTKLDISGWLKQASTFSYDADGRMLTQSAFRRDETVQVEWRRTLNGFEEHNTGVKAWVEAAYNEMQRNPDASWQVEQRYQLQTSTLSESTVTNFTSAAPTAARYNWRGQLVSAATPARGYDAAGNLLGYTVQEISGGTVRWTDTYSYEYSVQDGYLETKVTGTSSERNRRASETLSGYDGWGRRTSLEERTNLKREFGTVLRSARYFAYDAEGGLISRREGELVEEKNRPLQFRQARKEDARFKNFNPVPHLIEQAAWNAMSAAEREYWAGAANTHRYSFANGQLLGSVSEAGRMSVGDRLTGFANSSLGTSTVVVRSGETLRSVAQRIYGDGSLWYVLADANGLTNSDETLAEGQNLQVPQVGTNTNSASTFKPYDPSEQIGPTAPSLPTIAPPPKNSCNPIAQLLMVVVSVAIGFATFGAGVTFGAKALGLGAIGSNVVGGFIAGAAGGLAGQTVGSVTGVGSFSWRNVASNAVSSAITAGVGAAVGSVGGQAASVGRLLDAGRPIAAAGMALGNAAAGYIGNKVAGVQGTSFSWRNIAGSAVGSMLSSAAFNKLGWDEPSKFEVGGSFGQNLVTGFVGGLVSAHTQKAFGAEVRINEGRMALDAFGNALGNAIGGKILDAHQRKLAAKASLGQRWQTGGGFGDYFGIGIDARHEVAVGRQDSYTPAAQLSDGSFVNAAGERYGIGVGMTPEQRAALVREATASSLTDNSEKVRAIGLLGDRSATRANRATVNDQGYESPGYRNYLRIQEENELAYARKADDERARLDASYARTASIRRDIRARRDQREMQLANAKKWFESPERFGMGQFTEHLGSVSGGVQLLGMADLFTLKQNPLTTYQPWGNDGHFVFGPVYQFGYGLEAGYGASDGNFETGGFLKGQVTYIAGQRPIRAMGQRVANFDFSVSSTAEAQVSMNGNPLSRNGIQGRRSGDLTLLKGQAGVEIMKTSVGPVNIEGAIRFSGNAGSFGMQQRSDVSADWARSVEFHLERGLSRVVGTNIDIKMKVEPNWSWIIQRTQDASKWWHEVRK